MGRILFMEGAVDLHFTDQQVQDFKDMWEAGISIANMAKKLRRKRVELVLLLIELELCEEIKPRETGIFGL